MLPQGVQLLHQGGHDQGCNQRSVLGALLRAQIDGGAGGPLWFVERPRQQGEALPHHR